MNNEKYATEIAILLKFQMGKSTFTRGARPIRLYNEDRFTF